MNAISADLSPAVAAVNVGAAPAWNGMTVTAADGVPVHVVVPDATLTARSFTLYDVPFVRPGIVTGLASSTGLSATHVPEPFNSYS